MNNHQDQSFAFKWRIALSLLPGIFLGTILMVFYEPIPQPLDYHHFADNRMLLNIPHAGDVFTNLGLLGVGMVGLLFLTKPAFTDKRFISYAEVILFRIFFLGLCLTAFGSAWYHLAPNNASLVWDRLAMTICFMSLFAAMIAERIRLSLGIFVLVPLIILGIFSVIWWIWTEQPGQGDPRWYLLVQFYPLITIALMLVLLPTPYSKSNYYWAMFIFYTLAKLAELLDHEIFHFSDHPFSGHNLKHLLVSLSAVALLVMLYLRRPKSKTS